jgi:hypothetical protein
MISTGIVTRLVLHLDRDDAVGIARVALLDPWCLPLQAGDGDRLEVVGDVKGWHKREIDLVPRREITRGLTSVGELATFEVTKMPDIVRRLIPAGAGQGRLPGRRQQAVFRKHDIEGDRAAVLVTSTIKWQKLPGYG